jgi:putative DNA methylase
LAACRAVLFASIVDDPSSHPEEFPTEEAQEQERQRLFRIMERLVLWENTNNQIVLDEARHEILKATDGHPPAALDPFCGGGSIPLEAQRLGLEAHASDLNPVAVMITKAQIEIPPRFACQPPVNPDAQKIMQKKIQGRDWPGSLGLAEDVRYYGNWMREEAQLRLGHLYPKAKLADGSEATVIAWLWARTVKCPNPACLGVMPLVRDFSLSTKKGKETRVEPVIERGKDSLDIRFEIKAKQNELREGTVSRSGARCIFCGTPVSFNYIRSEGRSKRLGSQLMAIVAESKKGRIYLEPTLEHTDVAKNLHPAFIPDAAIVDNPGHTNVFRYGMTTFGDLFTPRQLIALTTLSDLISEVKERILHDAKSAGFSDCCIGVNNGGRGAQAYSEAVVTYLALAIDRLVDYNSTICSWIVSLEAIRNTFARQAIPMVWDFAEANPLSASVGSFNGALNWVADVIQSLPCAKDCSTYQFDSAEVLPDISNIIISTDPPYYDNITYADLSDFFYIWLRRSIFDIYPDIFSTVLTPKSQEIIAAAHRFGGNKEKAKQFFEERLAKSFSLIRGLQNSRFPLTIYYAFRQTEQDNKGRIHSDSVFKSTGWETMLSSLFEARFSITGTWPIRTERSARSVSLGSNALASSIVLVCRPRPEDAPLTTRREFIAALKRELPEAMRQLQKGNIAPVDLAQAAIGPGMAIFSRYSKVLEADGTPMRVRTALQLINQHLDEYLSEQEGEYDPDTRWALSWFEQYGMNEGLRTPV